MFFIHYGWMKLQFNEKINPGGLKEYKFLGYDYSHLDPKKKKKKKEVK